jgi:AhpD family alkylhydroperoxidase
MTQRLNYMQASPEGFKAIRGLQEYVEGSGLEHGLLELVKMRASQINGCAFCLDMHSKDARAAGETEQRLYLLDAWRESPFYSERERAALAWTEALTRVSQHEVTDSLYVETREQFSEK